MIKLTTVSFLTIYILMMSYVKLFAAEITKVSENKVFIRGNDINFKKGQRIIASNSEGQQTAQLKVYKVKGNGAFAKVSDGNPNKGDLVALQENETSSNLKSVNIRVLPISALNGVYHGEIDFGLGKRFTLGPSVGSFKKSETSDTSSFTISGQSFGVRSNIYLTSSRFESGFYLAPSLHYLKMNSEFKYKGVDLDENFNLVTKEYNSKMTMTGNLIQGVVGYQLMTNFGLNFNFGGGYNVVSVKYDYENNYDIPIVVKDTSGATQASGLALELTIGFAF